MSIFTCAKCGGFASADDGCEEVNGRLVCVDCLSETDDVADPSAAVQAAINYINTRMGPPAMATHGKRLLAILKR